MTIQTVSRTRTMGFGTAICAFAVVAALALFCPHASAQSGGDAGAADFPFPRAEKEFVALIPDLQDYCEHVTQGDTKAFITALCQYGPLDLQVRKAASPAEASRLRYFHLGIAAAASKMSDELAQGLGKPFVDVPGHVEGRQQRLTTELPQIEAFVKRFAKVPQITLLAHCGFKDEYRVNDTFTMMGQTKKAIPSSVMGFVPSIQWKVYKTPQEYLDTIHVSKSTFDGLYSAFKPLLVAAVLRPASGETEVIALGIANNTSGLLFVPNETSQPMLGHRLTNGETYSVVHQVKPNVYYFETR